MESGDSYIYIFMKELLYFASCLFFFKIFFWLCKISVGSYKISSWSPKFVNYLVIAGRKKEKQRNGEFVIKRRGKGIRISFSAKPSQVSMRKIKYKENLTDYKPFLLL